MSRANLTARLNLPRVEYVDVRSQPDHVIALAELRLTGGIVVLSCHYRTSSGLLIDGTAVYRDGHLVRGGLTGLTAVAETLATLGCYPFRPELH